MSLSNCPYCFEIRVEIIAIHPYLKKESRQANENGPLFEKKMINLYRFMRIDLRQLG